ncbi:MAG: hypothetical protein OEW60_00455 [Thiovulaceae bacterium]|nr:hypothetical protein [Sulfurimonadaceae bacterium]
MYTIEMEDPCSCFNKSGMEKTKTFEEITDAHNYAKVLECRMNQEFCLKHYFTAVDHGEKIIITKIVRPVDEDEDYEHEDVKTLIANSGVKIGFDDAEETPNGKKN